MKNIIRWGMFAVCMSSGLSLFSCFLIEDEPDNPIREEYRVPGSSTEGENESDAPQKISDIMAIIQTSQGDIGVKLYASKVPLTVANFLNLSKKGFYNGVTFHRVVKGFVIQAGDPTGTGSGGPGYKFRDETRPDLRHDSAGVLSMANSGPNTNGSQFFITQAATPHLDGKHTVFGEVVSGMNVVNRIEQGDIIKNVEVLSPTNALFKKEQANIDLWNQYLRR